MRFTLRLCAVAGSTPAHSAAAWCSDKAPPRVPHSSLCAEAFRLTHRRNNMSTQKSRFEAPAPPPAAVRAPTVLEDIAEETHSKYGAELFAPRTRDELAKDADTMYRAGLLKKYLPKDADRWNPQQRYAYATNRALIAFLAGAELGMLPLQSVRGIYFVEDQPSPAAKTLVGLIKKRTSICEYWMVEKATNTECQIVTKRRGTPKEERLLVTIDDFPKTWREEKSQYGTPKRPPWILWPSRQLHARCASWLAGQTYQDITLGFYAAEEMSSAAWERKYADIGRSMVQVPGVVESDADLNQMVEDANDGEATESPMVAASNGSGAQSAAEQPGKHPLLEAIEKGTAATDWAALAERCRAEPKSVQDALRAAWAANPNNPSRVGAQAPEQAPAEATPETP